VQSTGNDERNGKVRGAPRRAVNGRFAGRKQKMKTGSYFLFYPGNGSALRNGGLLPRPFPVDWLFSILLGCLL
jgi:hypothetical protein